VVAPTGPAGSDQKAQVPRDASGESEPSAGGQGDGSRETAAGGRGDDDGGTAAGSGSEDDQ
jgi:hypothetical protein